MALYVASFTTGHHKKEGFIFWTELHVVFNVVYHTRLSYIPVNVPRNFLVKEFSFASAG